TTNPSAPSGRSRCSGRRIWSGGAGRAVIPFTIADERGGSVRGGGQAAGPVDVPTRPSVAAEPCHPGPSTLPSRTLDAALGRAVPCRRSPRQRYGGNLSDRLSLRKGQEKQRAQAGTGADDRI